MNILKYMKEKVIMNRLKFFILMFALIFVDQMAKFGIILKKDSLPETIINGFLNFTYCENRGIAFGLASGHVQILSVITLLILIAIVVGVCRHFEKLNSAGAVGAALLIAGGFGNFIDRAFRLFVVDFIDISVISFPIFNFADICVVIGVIIIGIACLISYRRDEVEENNC